MTCAPVTRSALWNNIDRANTEKFWINYADAWIESRSIREKPDSATAVRSSLDPNIDVATHNWMMDLPERCKRKEWLFIGLIIPYLNIFSIRIVLIQFRLLTGQNQGSQNKCWRSYVENKYIRKMNHHSHCTNSSIQFMNVSSMFDISLISVHNHQFSNLANFQTSNEKGIDCMQELFISWMIPIHEKYPFTPSSKEVDLLTPTGARAWEKLIEFEFRKSFPCKIIEFQFRCHTKWVSVPCLCNVWIGVWVSCLRNNRLWLWGFSFQTMSSSWLSSYQ